MLQNDGLRALANTLILHPFAYFYDFLDSGSAIATYRYGRLGRPRGLAFCGVLRHPPRAPAVCSGPCDTCAPTLYGLAVLSRGMFSAIAGGVRLPRKLRSFRLCCLLSHVFAHFVSGRSPVQRPMTSSSYYVRSAEHRGGIYSPLSGVGIDSAGASFVRNLNPNAPFAFLSHSPRRSREPCPAKNSSPSIPTSAVQTAGKCSSTGSIRASRLP